MKSHSTPLASLLLIAICGQTASAQATQCDIINETFDSLSPGKFPTTWGQWTAKSLFLPKNSPNQTRPLVKTIAPKNNVIVGLSKNYLKPWWASIMHPIQKFDSRRLTIVVRAKSPSAIVEGANVIVFSGSNAAYRFQINGEKNNKVELSKGSRNSTSNALTESLIGRITLKASIINNWQTYCLTRDILGNWSLDILGVKQNIPMGKDISLTRFDNVELATVNNSGIDHIRISGDNWVDLKGGCAGSLPNTPQLMGFNGAIGQTATVTVTRPPSPPPLLVHVFFVGLGAAKIPLACGNLQVSPLLIQGVFGLPTYSIGIPNAPGLAGIDVHFQAMSMPLTFNTPALSNVVKLKLRTCISDKKTITTSRGMKLNRIPAGTFMMGSPKNEKDRNAWEGPLHKVTLTRAFYMQQTTVTQGLWYAVMGTRPWRGKKNVKEGDAYAATWMSWYQAVAFCQKLSKQEGKTYRLPTEAEWEYACRAATQTRYSYGNDLNYAQLKHYAWFDANAKNVGQMYAHPVAQMRPNPWGLFDMHGNVEEWCKDRYGPYSSSSKVDPQGPSTGSTRVQRGGSFAHKASNSRAALRNAASTPSHQGYSVGFRVVRLVK